MTPQTETSDTPVATTATPAAPSTASTVISKLVVPSAPQTPVQIAAKPKNGFLSSEFLTTAATVITIAAGLVPAQYAPIVAALSGVYVAGRTLLKMVHAAGFAKALPDLPELPEVTGKPEGV